MELTYGAYRFELSCWWHKATWTKDVTVAETATLVGEFVAESLAAERAGTVVPVPRHPASGTTVQA
ncbi:hypothetical protein ACIPJS_13595 [Streptomyces sp. NPDC086783]|uniref:hypothetical protein n=1 Tax=Streptomyces sp. NPDC086783 TaxID=3365758 RepID=UPI003825E1FB